MNVLIRSGKKRNRGRRGAAVVEFAIVLPLLCIVLFGIIEWGYVFMVRQSMQNAAREGVRVAILQSTDAPYEEVTTRVDELMNATGITGYTLEMQHASVGDPMETVTIRVPNSQVSLIGFTGGFTGDELVASCSMRKEGMGG